MKNSYESMNSSSTPQKIEEKTTLQETEEQRKMKFKFNFLKSKFRVEKLLIFYNHHPYIR